MRRAEPILILIAVAIASLLVGSSEQERIKEWGIRYSFFDPRNEKMCWADVLGCLGKNYLCNQHPSSETNLEGPHWRSCGVWQQDDSVILELDVRASAGECHNLLPFRGGALPVSGLWSDFTVFLDGEAVGKGSLELDMPAQGYRAQHEPPKNYRRIQFRITGLSPERVGPFVQAVENNPRPKEYVDPNWANRRGY